MHRTRTRAVALSVVGVAAAVSTAVPSAQAATPFAPAMRATAPATARAAVPISPKPPTETEEQTRVIGGGLVPDDETYPWMGMVSIHIEKGYGQCGGTLVSQDIVVTAAHCFLETVGANGKPIDLTVYMGKRTAKAAKAAGQDIPATKYKHGTGLVKDDWAVIKLDRTHTVPFMPKLARDTSLDKSPKFRVLGWGKTAYVGPLSDDLKYADPIHVDNGSNKCAQDASDMPQNHICAGNGNNTTCAGDSGGPLLAPPAGVSPENAKPDSWTLVGITSWAYACGSRDQSATRFARVSLYGPKILNAIKELGGTMPAL